ncbi:hypothetical protein B0O80DRAFT_429774 [Mortierella sp. GBAus27b]|nr:hypothetical protein B0O80DRAFT_429774 [Mortierella sp. GBAus27b]
MVFVLWLLLVFKCLEYLVVPPVVKCNLVLWFSAEMYQTGEGIQHCRSGDEKVYRNAEEQFSCSLSPDDILRLFVSIATIGDHPLVCPVSDTYLRKVQDGELGWLQCVIAYDQGFQQLSSCACPWFQALTSSVLSIDSFCLKVQVDFNDVLLLPCP